MNILKVLFKKLYLKEYIKRIYLKEHIKSGLYKSSP